jgi:hypothetical protein
MVQEAIRMVLESIYEPVFQHMNCSFGFRARNGVHHAITMLKDPRNTSGLTHIIEGDSCFPAVLALIPFLKYLSDILRGCYAGRNRSSTEGREQPLVASLPKVEHRTFGRGCLLRFAGKRCLKKSRIEGFVFRFGK